MDSGAIESGLRERQPSLTGGSGGACSRRCSATSVGYSFHRGKSPRFAVGCSSAQVGQSPKRSRCFQYQAFKRRGSEGSACKPIWARRIQRAQGATRADNPRPIGFPIQTEIGLGIQPAPFAAARQCGSRGQRSGIVGSRGVDRRSHEPEVSGQRIGSRSAGAGVVGTPASEQSEHVCTSTQMGIRFVLPLDGNRDSDRLELHSRGLEKHDLGFFESMGPGRCDQPLMRPRCRNARPADCWAFREGERACEIGSDVSSRRMDSMLSTSFARSDWNAGLGAFASELA